MRPNLLTKHDFFDIAGSDIDLIAERSGYFAGGKMPDNYRIIGIKTVPSSAIFCLGHPRDNRGYGGIVYVRLDSTGGGQIHGKIRIHFADAPYNKIVKMKEWSTHEQDGTAVTDKSKNPTVAPVVPYLKQNGHVILSILPDNPTVDVDIDVSDTNNKIMIPIMEGLYNEEKEME